MSDGRACAEDKAAAAWKSLVTSLQFQGQEFLGLSLQFPSCLHEVHSERFTLIYVRPRQVTTLCFFGTICITHCLDYNTQKSVVLKSAWPFQLTQPKGSPDDKISCNMSPTTAQQPLVDHGLRTIEASRSHSDTPHSVCLVWSSDQPDAQTSPDNTQHSQHINLTWQHTTLTTYKPHLTTHNTHNI